MADLPIFESAEPEANSKEMPDIVESQGEALQFLTKPSAAKSFKSISQDNVLSFLDSTEVNLVAMNSGTLQLLDHYDFRNTMDVIQTEISSLLATARSRGGFAAKLLVTNILEGTDKIAPEALQNPNVLRPTLGGRQR